MIDIENAIVDRIRTQILADFEYYARSDRKISGGLCERVREYHIFTES